MASLSFNAPAGFGGGYFRATSFSDGLPVVIAGSLVPSDLGSGSVAAVDELDDDTEDDDNDDET